MAQILNGQITYDMDDAFSQYVLYVGDDRWKLYEYRDDSSRSRKYHKLPLSDNLVFTDKRQGKVAIKSGCEQNIVNTNQVVPPKPKAEELSVVKDYGTIIPKVQTTNVYIPGLSGTTKTSIPGTQILPQIGNSITIDGVFQPSSQYCTPGLVGKCLFEVNQLIVLSIPSNALSPIPIYLPLSGTTLNTSLTQNGGIIMGYVESYIPPIDSSNGKLTLKVLFSSFNIPFISNTILNLLPYLSGLNLPNPLGELVTQISPLLDFLTNYISGPILNGQAITVLSLSSREQLPQVLNQLRIC